MTPIVCDFALVTMLGLLGLRIFEACGSDIAHVGGEHGHRVLRVVGKGLQIVLVPLPPAVGRAIDRAIEDRASDPILLNQRGRWKDRRAATRRLRRDHPFPDTSACGGQIQVTALGVDA